jgi:hypothetical protein
MGLTDPLGEAILSFRHSDEMDMILHQAKGPYGDAESLDLPLQQSEIEGLVFV